MPRKFERAAVLLVLVASPLWLPAVPSHVGSHLRMTFASWLQPGFQFVQSARQGLGHFANGFFRGMDLEEENRRLSSKLKTLVAHEETHQQLSDENARLRALLEFQVQAPWNLIAAEVIARELSPWSRSLLLNRGARDGIHKGMAVMTPAGLVGRVNEVGRSSSRVKLITDSHFRVPGWVAKVRTGGLIRGGSSGQCVLTYLPLNSKVEPGQAVLTAGGNSFCPKGIPIGKVSQVQTDPSELFLSARVQPAVDVHAVEEVLIIEWPPSGPHSSS